jgi:hypothetical protein
VIAIDPAPLPAFGALGSVILSPSATSYPVLRSL